MVLDCDFCRGAGIVTVETGAMAGRPQKARRAGQCGTHPSPAVGDGFSGVGWSFARTRLLAFGDIPNERENGEVLLGGNRRPEQAQLLEGPKLALSHVVTCHERAIFGESLP
jgi:hypothetical protein